MDGKYKPLDSDTLSHVSCMPWVPVVKYNIDTCNKIKNKNLKIRFC